MDKQGLKLLVEKFNNGSISEVELNQLENEIENGSINLTEFPELVNMDNQLNFDIPEPSKNLRTDFYRNLAAIQKSKTRLNLVEGIGIWLTNLGLSRPAVQIVYASILIIMGFGIGQWTQSSSPDDKIDALTDQVSEMRALMMLTLIKEPTATDRLKAVNLVMDAQNVDEKMIEALLNTLNHDENANVRLATLNALLRYANKPQVRKGLIEAIPYQDNAMLQYSLAEAMILMQEKNSVQNFQELLKDQNLDADVKNKIQETISKLS